MSNNWLKTIEAFKAESKAAKEKADKDKPIQVKVKKKSTDDWLKIIEEFNAGDKVAKKKADKDKPAQAEIKQKPSSVIGARVWRLSIRAYDSGEVSIVNVIDPYRESKDDFINRERQRFGVDKNGMCRVIECKEVKPTA